MSIDVEGLKAKVDILRVAEGYTTLRHKGRAWTGRCPLPGHEDNRPSFAVYADTNSWCCFGGCGGGSVIDLVMRVEGVDFKTACERLGAEEFTPRKGESMPRPYVPPKTDDGAPDGVWQLRAEMVIQQGEANLWGDAGAKARDYLMRTRGLSERIIREARLGYIPGGYVQWEQIEGLKVPCGIVIPWIIHEEVWAVKVRRAAGNVKYQQVAGGSSYGLYRVDKVEAWQDVLITEGEFDALVVAQTTSLVAAVALGSASNTLRDRWLYHLIRCPAIFARLDGDEAGRSSMRRLQTISSRVQPVQVPAPHKDINDYWLADGAGFRIWVRHLDE